MPAHACSDVGKDTQSHTTNNMEELWKRKSKPRPPPLDPSGPRRPRAAKANLGESERRNDLKHRLQTALHEIEFRKRLTEV